MSVEEPEPQEPRGGEGYSTASPRSRSSPQLLRFLYRGRVLSFEVDRGVFASHGLDPGTALLVEALDPSPEARVLDLGCGWGPVGIAAARAAPLGRVVLVDVNRRALGLARANLRRNAVTNAEVRAGSLFGPVGAERFDLIATNPPYRSGRPLVLRLLSECPAHLAAGGRLLMVGKSSQGIRYYQEWLAEHGFTVAVRSRGSGYRVLEARPPPPSR